MKPLLARVIVVLGTSEDVRVVDYNCQSSLEQWSTPKELNINSHNTY
jgi:hypothetical protein